MAKSGSVLGGGHFHELLSLPSSASSLLRPRPPACLPRASVHRLRSSPKYISVIFLKNFAKAAPAASRQAPSLAVARDGRSLGSSATSPAAVRVVLHLRRGRTEVQLQRPDQRPCLASMQWRACSSMGRDGRLQACARLPRRRRLRTALEHRSRAKVGELHHQLPQGFVRAATAAATAGTASSPAAHVVRAVPHGTHGA